ncbi:hypothetical protein [Helicobacter cynogastricus]|uniref:hypothetical protein n=1 Tax=Helicobacter cynogastricus TaxID=329937 RepID=UPI0013159D90|nr:hypothetical protein [Helicobacter cynogastricus]
MIFKFLLKKPKRAPRVYYKSADGFFYSAHNYKLSPCGQFVVRKSDGAQVNTLERTISY